MNADVSAYFAKGDAWQKHACMQLRQAIQRAVPGVEESMQYGKPHYAVDGELVAALHLAKSKVSLLILGAQSVPPEKGFLRSLGNGERKVVDVTEEQNVDIARVVAALRAARR
jgi:hypothetical protein